MCAAVPGAGDRVVAAQRTDVCSAARGPLTDTTSFKRPAFRHRNRRPDCVRQVRECGPVQPPALPHCPPKTSSTDEWEARGDEFNLTKAGYLGTHRKSMLRNKLLVVDEVGVSRFKHCEPPPDRTHGIVTAGSPSRTLLHHTDWDCKKGGSKGCQKKSVEDFIALNRASVTSGVVTLSGVRDYRNTHSIKIKPPDRKFVEIPDIVFGDPSGWGSRQDRARDVMTSLPLTEWITCVKSRQRQGLSQALMNENLGRRSENNAYHLRMLRAAPRVEGGVTWHMPRFTRVKPRVSSFRCKEDVQALMHRSGLNDDHVMGSTTGIG